MRKFLYRATMIAWLALWSMGLVGCGAATAVIGGCEIPQQYDVTKAVGPDLPPQTHQKAFDEAATAERGQHKHDVDDFNGFHDYVKVNCK